MIKKYDLMSEFVKATNPTVQILDYLIKTTFNYFLIYNRERNATILFEQKNYKSITKEDNIYYIHSKNPISVIQNETNNMRTEAYISTFEVNLYGGDEVIGFRDIDEVFLYCDKKSINTCKNKLVTKLIFSPQLANYLLDKGYQIVHLKPHSANNQTIFVFTVEEKFYEEIGNYHKRYGNNSNAY